MTEGDIIWRYFDLPKFVDFIQTSSLFFSRADLLREIDRYEGRRLSDTQKKHLKEIIEDDRNNISLELINIFYIEYGISCGGKEYIDLSEDERRDGAKFMAKSILKGGDFDDIDILFINCWNKNNNENYALWKIYAKDYGIAITSKVSNIKLALDPKILGNIHFIDINYIDYNANKREIRQFWRNYSYKRKEFAYENELRLIYIEESENIREKARKLDGVKKEVNLNILIDKIYVSPFAPTWFYNVVKGLCDKYELIQPVIQSII